MHQTLQDLETELTGSLTGLTSAQTIATPPDHPEKWCIQEIIGHLLLSYASTTQLFESRIAKGRATRTKPTVPQRLGQFYILTLERFPQGRRAPDAVCPPPPCPTCNGAALIQRVHVELTRLDAAIDRAADLFGGDVRAISHIVLGPLSVDGWRTFHLVHGRHHLGQILALRSSGALLS